jgi:hypothetical protein
VHLEVREIRFVGVDWIHMTPDNDLRRALVNTVMNRRVLLKAGNFSTI